MADHPFQGKDVHEGFQFYFRQHWIRLLGPFVRMLLATIAILTAGYVIFFFLGVEDAEIRRGILIVLFFLLAAVQWNFLLRFYMYFLYVVVATDRRVHRIKKTLFSIDDHQTIDLWTFQEIEKKQHGIIQYIFGFGTLILESQDTQLRIHFVPRIDHIYDHISNLRERAREQKQRVSAERDN